MGRPPNIVLIMTDPQRADLQLVRHALGTTDLVQGPVVATILQSFWPTR